MCYISLVLVSFGGLFRVWSSFLFFSLARQPLELAVDSVNNS